MQNSFFGTRSWLLFANLWKLDSSQIYLESNTSENCKAPKSLRLRRLQEVREVWWLRQADPRSEEGKPLFRFAGFSSWLAPYIILQWRTPRYQSWDISTSDNKQLKGWRTSKASSPPWHFVYPDHECAQSKFDDKYDTFRKAIVRMQSLLLPLVLLVSLVSASSAASYHWPPYHYEVFWKNITMRSFVKICINEVFWQNSLLLVKGKLKKGNYGLTTPGGWMGMGVIPKPKRPNTLKFQ